MVGILGFVVTVSCNLHVMYTIKWINIALNI